MVVAQWPMAAGLRQKATSGNTQAGLLWKKMRRWSGGSGVITGGNAVVVVPREQTVGRGVDGRAMQHRWQQSRGSWQGH